MNPEQLLAEFDAIAQARGWQGLHSARNLATAAAVEAGELLALFQWLDEAQARQAEGDPAWCRQVGDEVADVILYLLALCRRLGIDPRAALADKLARNRERFLGPGE